MAETVFTAGPKERIFPNKPGDDIADDQPEQFTPFDSVLPSSVLDVAKKTREMTASGPGLTTFQEYLKSEEEFIQKTKTDGPQDIQDRVFEQGLSGDVDLNTLFPGQKLLQDDNSYTLLKDAKKAETAGNASPDQVAILNEARTGNLREEYNYLLPTNTALHTGIQETGQFPINMMTGEVILPPSVPKSRAEGYKTSLETNLQEKAEDAAHLKNWIQTRPDAPTNPKVLDALVQSVEADLGDAFAERLYSLANATKEGVGFYLPYYTGFAYDSAVGNDVSEYTDERRQKELIEFRDSAPLFADRQTVMNDILREQLRLTLGEQEFDRLELGKKVTVDGIEKYKVNFVGEKFANDMFEELFDMQGLPSKIAALVGENTIAYTLLKAPFVVSGTLYRGVQRAVRKSTGKDVPFKYMSATDQAAAVATNAQLKNVTLASSAKQLANESAYSGFITRFRQRSLQQFLTGRAGAMDIVTQQSARFTRIEELQRKLTRAEKLNVKPENINVLVTQLNRELALQNWASVRKLAPTAREYGINPVFDITMAMSQIGGRNLFPENPQFGELVGVGSMLGLYAVGKIFKLQSGVPLLGGFASGVSFRAKVATEALTGGLFTLVGAAKRGYGEGWLVNPNLKAIVNISADAKKNFTAAELRAYDVFTKGLMDVGGDPQFTDTMLANLSQTFDDMDTVVKSLPPAMQQEARAVLQMSLGQASQMNLFFSMAASIDANQVQLKPKAFIKVQSSIREKLQIQVEADKQVAALGLATNRIDQMILKLRESGDSVQSEAADRLEILSGSFKSASAQGSLQQELLRSRNLQGANKLLEDLSNPNLSISSRKQAILSGQVEDLIELITKSENRFDSEVGRFSGTSSDAAPIATSVDAKSRQAQELQTKAVTADNALSSLSDAVIQGTESSRLPMNAAQTMENASSQVSQLAKLARVGARKVVNEEYSKISTTTPIEFTPVATNLLEVFSAYRLDTTTSIAKAANPISAKAFGGTTGVRMMQGMDNASQRGLVKLFSNESVLSQMSEATGIQFAGADDLIAYLKNDYYGTDPRVLTELGVSAGNEISNLQLSLKLISDTELPINARNLSFIATPKEMEDLRQAANQLGKSSNEDKQNLGKLVVTSVDDTLEKWGSTLNVNDYNQVARARVLSRLESQRFDEGTLGYEIERITAGDIQILAGEGGTTQLTKGGRQVADLLKPLIDNIVSPTPTSTAIVKTQLDRLSTTFAPLSPSLADNILVKGPDGKFRIPTGDEVSESTVKVMDLDGYQKLRAIIETSVKNRFLETTGMDKVSAVLRADVRVGPDGKRKVPQAVPVLSPADMPQAIKVPPQYDGDLAAYLESIEDAFTFMVKDGDNPPVMMKLFDTDDLLTADRDVVNIVNMSKEYQQTHADLLSVAKTAAGEAGITDDAASTLRLTELAEVHKSSQTTVGREFYDKVIMSGDANAAKAYLTRTNSAIGPDKTQEATSALFTEVIKAAGEYGPGRRTVKMFDGQDVPVDSYGRPDIVFSLLDDAIQGTTIEGRKLKALADAAGVDDAQLETLHAIFRLSTKTEAPRLVREANGNLAQSTKGFTLDNTLSKAFNIARGMVSKEYVAAEAALRYAAMGKGKIVSLILKDKRSAEVIYNVLKDETRVSEGDALYLAQAVMKFVAGDLSRAGVSFDTPVTDNKYIEEYWKSQGLIFDFDE